MDFLKNNRKILIGLLSSAIRGEAYYITNISDIDWQAIFEEAVQHQVLSLLYPLLHEVGSTMGVPKTLLEKWRNNALCQGIEQERNYCVIGKVFELFNNAGISTIVLKGLVLRELYPYPYLRTMGDFDLLLKPGDMEKAGRLLAKAGYRMNFDNGKHVEYSHRSLPVVELHRSLVYESYFQKCTDFETKVWEKSVPLKVSGTMLFSLCPQHKVLYLSMHMATHIISSGFGLRQLCDFVLFIEKYRNEIDWVEFFKMAELYHIEDFLKVLLEVCHVLLGLKLPEICQEYEPQNVLLVRSLIEDIFDGGVFGKKGIERITANRLLYYNGRFMNLLFPKAEKLENRFAYARNHHFLLPVAWIHRIFYCIVRKDIDFAEKTAVFTSGTPAKICRKRSILLRKLGLLD